MARWLAPVLAVFAFGWLALILTAPFLPLTLSAFTYVIGSLICHQIPERSFHLQSFQLPVCARCLGLYSGSAVAAVLTAVPFAIPPTRDRLLVTAISAIPTIVTVVLEWIGVWKPSNVTRALAGAPLGFTVAVIVITSLRHRERLQQPTLHYE